MTRDGKPTWVLKIYGDWSTVISTRNDAYRDQLLKQAPDADDRDLHWEYRITFANIKELQSAIAEFADRLHCVCDIEMTFMADGLFVSGSTGNHDDHEPYCRVEINQSMSLMETLVRDAIETLEKAVA